MQPSQTHRSVRNTIAYPLLGHLRELLDQPIILLIQINHGHLLARHRMHHTTAPTQKDNLQRLQRARQLPRNGICVHIQNLPVRRLRETGDDGQCACADTGLDGGAIDAGDLADEAVLFAIEVVADEGAANDGTGACPQGFQGLDEFEIFRLEALAYAHGVACTHKAKFQQ